MLIFWQSLWTTNGENGSVHLNLPAPLCSFLELTGCKIHWCADDNMGFLRGFTFTGKVGALMTLHSRMVNRNADLSCCMVLCLRRPPQRKLFAWSHTILVFHIRLGSSQGWTGTLLLNTNFLSSFFMENRLKMDTFKPVEKKQRKMMLRVGAVHKSKNHRHFQLIVDALNRT